MTVDAAPARRPWRRRLGIVASLLVVVFLGWAMVDGWSQVRAYSWHIRPWELAASVAVLGVFIVANGVGYLGAVEGLTHTRPPRVKLLSAWATSLLGRYVPGSVLMVVGRMEMAAALGVRRSVSVAALVYEQALGLGVAALASVGFVAAYGNTGSGWSLAAVALTPLLLVALHPRVFGPVSRWVLAKAGRPPLERLISPRRIVALVGWYILTSSLLSLGVWLGLRGLAGTGVGSVVFVGGAFLFAFTLSTLLVIFPSGLGVREGVLAVALSQHVPQGVAVALSVWARLLLTLVELAVVGLLVIWARRR